MAYERKDYTGGAVESTLASGINASVESLTLADATGWPDGAAGHFFIVVDPDTSSEEKIRCLSRSGTTVTVVSTTGRGSDDTSAAAHASGATVKHVFTALDADEANYAASETVGKVTAAGQLLVGDGTNSLAALANGTTGQPLLAGASTPAYGQVDTGGIAADAIDGTKIEDDAVNSEHIAAGAVDLEHMSANSVDSDQYVDGSVDLIHMSANSVDSDQYVDASIDTAHLADNAVTAAKVAADVATQAEIDLKAPLNLTLNAQTGTTYTLVLTDNHKLVTLSNAAGITLTVPTNATAAFPTGSTVLLAQIGAGQVTVAAAGGVTVNGTPTLKARAQHSSLALVKTATDAWLLVGDLATS